MFTGQISAGETGAKWSCVCKETQNRAFCDHRGL
jgi:hypothetical protein